MKKILSLTFIFSFLLFTVQNNYAVSQDQEMEVVEATEIQEAEVAPEPQSVGFTQELKNRFIEGGPGFMGIVLACLILGLAIAIERIIYLNFATTNTDKLTADVESALKSGGVEAAKEVCRNTPGPVASIFYQGLDRAGEGVESAEKAVVAYGGVQMGQLEKNVSWISLFIALAPMLGFMGTVIGMIQAFDKIQAAGDMQPSLVAGGIKVALLTTVFGLIVAIILQIFYNYIVSKIDSIVNDMEDSSITLIDILVSHKKIILAMNIQKITNILAIGLGVLGLIFLVLIISAGDDKIEMDAMNGDYGFVAAIIYLAFLVLAIVVLSTVVFSVMNLVSDKNKLKKAGISIGSFLLVIIIAFVLSEGVETPMQDGKVLSASGSRWVETGIRTFYLLTLIAGGIMIYNSVRNMFKK